MTELIVLTAAWCSACPAVKTAAAAVAREKNILLRIIDIEQSPGYGVGVTQLPVVRLVKDGAIYAQASGLLRRDQILSVVGAAS